MAFDNLKGNIYIEAFKEANVREAVQGIAAIKESGIRVVPMTEMTAIFNYDKVEKIDIKIGQWVRVKTGLYEHDLGKVIDIEDPVSRIIVKVVPRLEDDDDEDKKKKKEKKANKKGVRPRQKLFNYKEHDGVKTKLNAKSVEEELFNKMTFQNGFLVKSFRAKALIVDDVIPKIDELRTFEFVKKDDDDEDNYNLLSKIKDSDLNKRRTFNKGDKIKIIKGGLINVTGVVESSHDNIVQLRLDIEGFPDLLEYSTDFLVKHFLPGDNVKVKSCYNMLLIRLLQVQM